MKKNKVQTNASIRKRLIFSFMLLSLTPIFMIGFLSYHYCQKAITRKITKYSQAELMQTVANVQTKLAEFENTLVRLFINMEFNSALTALSTANEEAQFIAAKKRIEVHFKEYMISNQDIFGFMFVSEPNPDYSVLITKDYYDEFTELVKDFKEQNAYRTIMTAGGGIVWSSALKINRSHFVLLGRQIKHMSSGDSLGILGIILDEERIDQLINLNIYTRLYISLAEIGSYSLVINNDGEIVSTPFKEDIGKDFSKIIKETKPLDEIFSLVSNRDYGSEVNQGSFITEVNERPTLVTFKTIGSKVGIGGKSGWHLLSLAPTSFLYADVKRLAYATFGLGLLFALASVGISFYLTSLLDRKQTPLT